jgi:hypothetical protein
MITAMFLYCVHLACSKCLFSCYSCQWCLLFQILCVIFVCGLDQSSCKLIHTNKLLGSDLWFQSHRLQTSADRKQAPWHPLSLQSHRLQMSTDRKQAPWHPLSLPWSPVDGSQQLDQLTQVWWFRFLLFSSLFLFFFLFVGLESHKVFLLLF